MKRNVYEKNYYILLVYNNHHNIENMQATAPPAEGTPEAEELHKEYLAKWHAIFRKEAKQREHDVNASLGMGGRKRRHGKKSGRHAKKSRRHAKKSLKSRR